MAKTPNGRIGINPFWQNETTESSTKRTLKIILKWVKFAVYTFFMIMGLWGCFQSMVDYSIGYSSTSEMSSGFEIGTNNNYHHVISGQTVNYFVANSPADAKEYGPFVFLFLYPLSWLTSKLIHSMGVTGGSVLGAIIIVTISVRLIQMSITIKSVFAQEKMNLLAREQARIKAKYVGKTDPHSKQKQQMEIMALYKKHNVNPLSSLGQMFVTMPLLITVSRMIMVTGEIKNTPIWKWNLSESMLNGIKGGNWSYVILLVILIPLQFFQFQLPGILSKKRGKNRNNFQDQKTKDAYKKQTRMMKIMPIMFAVFAFLTSSGIAIYWIISSILMMGQTLLVHHITLKREAKKRKK